VRLVLLEGTSVHDQEGVVTHHVRQIENAFAHEPNAVVCRPNRAG